VTLDLRSAINAGPVLDRLIADISRPGWGRNGRKNARELAERYAAGLPLVRRSRKLGEVWTFVCPVPACQVLRDGFQTIRACRDGWFAHVQDDRHDGFTPAWPDDLEPEPVQEVLDLFADGSVAA
jgi:hypothetical protein